MAYPRIEISKDDIFISSAMMNILRNTFHHGSGFSIIINDIYVEEEEKEIKYRWGSVRRKYITVTVEAMIKKRPSVVPFTITKSTKHINPLKVMRKEVWFEFTNVFSDLFGSTLTLYPEDEMADSETVMLYAVKQFKMLNSRRAVEIINRTKKLKEFLPFEIWKSPKEPPSEPQYKTEWWKSYISSLNRALTPEEISLMPKSLLFYAMYHDLLVVFSALLQATHLDKLIKRIKDLR